MSLIKAAVAHSTKIGLIAFDAVLINVAVVVAFLLRFEFAPPDTYIAAYVGVAIPFTLATLVNFGIFSLFSRAWEYTSSDDIQPILGSSIVSAGLLAIAEFLYPRPIVGFPRSVVVLTAVIEAALLAGSRLGFRAYEVRRHVRRTGGTGGRRLLLVGAGDAGFNVAGELRRHPEIGVAVAFVDDDPRKNGLRVRGIRVMGMTQDVPRLVAQLQVDDVLVTIPAAPPALMRRIVQACAGLPVKVKTIPAMFELLNGHVSASAIREVQIEDLLGRAPVQVDLDQVTQYLRGRVVLVTGAGGSIGAELCVQVAGFRPERLILVGHGENALFETDAMLQRRFPGLDRRLVVADVRDLLKMDRIMKREQPHVVFHAAAHKHVHLMEFEPDEAIKTNVFGTLNVAQAAISSGVERFVLISTDKAVNPANVMGATKRLAEMLVTSLNGKNQTRFMTVRFGNVLGSRGSVVPTFKEQIASGGPVTVTHPHMKRFFMTIPEAVSLVLQAAAIGLGGEVFTLDMGDPVRIMDLAVNLIRLSGLRPNEDIEIVISGVRPGEKLEEELVGDGEVREPTSNRRIFTSVEPAVDSKRLDWCLKELQDSLGAPDAGAWRTVLHIAVPTYHAAASVLPEVAATRDAGMVVRQADSAPATQAP